MKIRLYYFDIKALGSKHHGQTFKILAILSKSFYSVTMKLGLQAYQRYFQVCLQKP